jgi:hypothetical protein
MRIKVGDRYRDYVGVSYVIKSYKNSIITFEVDGGDQKDESCSKNEFLSELDGNRFHKDLSSIQPLYSKEQMRMAYMCGKHGGKTQTHYEFEDFIKSLKTD